MDHDARNINLQIRHLLGSCQQVLENPESESTSVVTSLNQIKHLLPPSELCILTGDAPFPQEILTQARREFLHNHHRKWLDLLINVLSVELLSKFPKGQLSDLFDVFFLEGSPTDSLISLVKAIDAESQAFKVQWCTGLLESFLQKQKLSQLIWDQCEVGRKQKIASGKVDPYTQQTWHEILIYVATIPERITNKLHKETRDIFYPEHYIPTVVRDILQALGRVHLEIQNNRETSVLFVSQLVGKICLSGYGGALWGALLPVLVVKMENDFIWSRIMENVLRHVPDMAMEATITPMIQASPWYGTLNRLLGNTILSDQKLEYLMTRKLLFLRYYKTNILLQNVIGYLASSTSRKHLFHKVLESLVEVWGDASAIKHTSYDQHQYISRAILICLAFLSDKDAELLRSKLTELLLQGMQPHLDSSIHQVRRLGMIVAENISKKVELAGQQQKLTFEYDRDQEVELLLSLLDVPKDPGLPSEPVDDLENNVHTGEESRQELPSQPSDEPRSAEPELDSDDDLEPYDMPNDPKVTKFKGPRYVRDCMEGLLNSDEPDKVESCLHAAEKLIRNNPSTVKEIAVEFTKILVHLEDRFSLPAFSLWRQAALTALATSSPAEVADYLTSQFYDRNYNIRQRLDMLEVLAAAARELSRPQTVATREAPPLVQEDEESDINWQQIVQRRVEAKTRRFASSSSRPQAEHLPNRFGGVAGHFFFPLLKTFDSQEMTLDLLGTDHLVLTRLIYTLGVVLHAALNLPIARQMGSSMLDFIWTIRFHQQPAVRQGALFAMSMVILTLPSFTLVTEMQKEITEAKFWLEGVFRDDPDKECQKMALQTLVLIENAVKEVVL